MKRVELSRGDYLLRMSTGEFVVEQVFSTQPTGEPMTGPGGEWWDAATGDTLGWEWETFDYRPGSVIEFVPPPVRLKVTHIETTRNRDGKWSRFMYLTPAPPEPADSK